MSTKIANIETHPYNQGNLAGRYALADLSNSGVLTNTIMALPERYQIKQANGVLTLKRGSTITIPNGFSEQDTHYNTYLYIAEDMSYEIPAGKVQTEVENPEDSPANYTYLVYDRDENKLRRVFSTSFIGLGHGITFDLEQNYVTSYDDHRVSLPLGYIDTNRVFHSFNTIGFYDNIMWVDKGVKYAIADGRNFENKLDTYKINVNDTTYTTLEQTPCTKHVLLIDSSAAFSITPRVAYGEAFEDYIGDYLTYVSDDNYMYNSEKTPVLKCKTAQISVDAVNTKIKGAPVVVNLIKDLTHFNTYKLVNYTDVKDNFDNDIQEAIDLSQSRLEAAVDDMNTQIIEALDVLKVQLDDETERLATEP